MCGFVGFTRPNTICEPATILAQMNERIIHRGPDEAGRHLCDEIALGFRRLSFLDLDGGTQPMYNADRSLVIVFNGEIYNFETLREELIADGGAFQTSSDTEVLLYLYERHGREMLDKLRGMFAFVLCDFTRGELFGARDPFGIKPLYYTTAKESFLFGSEIKSFLDFPSFVRKVNPAVLEHYLSFQYSPTAETFFQGVFKLMPGHCFTMRLDDTSTLEISRYFSASFEEQDWELDTLTSRLNSTMRDSIRHHEIADVEIGSFLSSGVDSSYVAANSGIKKTFTVGFDHEGYSEIECAGATAKHLGIRNESKCITAEEFWGVLPKIQWHMDEPMADPSAVPLYFLSHIARGEVKACLSGEGADELFGGYAIYREPQGLRPLTALPRPLRRALGTLAKILPDNCKGKSFFERGSRDLEERYIGNANIFSKEEREMLLKNPVKAPAPTALTQEVFQCMTTSRKCS